MISCLIQVIGRNVSYTCSTEFCTWVKKRENSPVYEVFSTWMTLRTAVNFDFAPNVRGVEILRHGAGLLCESCQAMIEANPRFLHK